MKLSINIFIDEEERSSWTHRRRVWVWKNIYFIFFSTFSPPYSCSLLLVMPLRENVNFNPPSSPLPRRGHHIESLDSPSTLVSTQFAVFGLIEIMSYPIFPHLILSSFSSAFSSPSYARSPSRHLLGLLLYPMFLYRTVQINWCARYSPDDNVVCSGRNITVINNFLLCNFRVRPTSTLISAVNWLLFFSLKRLSASLMCAERVESGKFSLRHVYPHLRTHWHEPITLSAHDCRG